MAISLAQTLHNGKILSGAMRANLTYLSKIGITEQSVEELDNMLEAVSAKDAEQEKIKAKLIAATAELNELTKQLNHLMQNAVKRVKVEVPTEQWKEYGIQAKK